MKNFRLVTLKFHELTDNYYKSLHVNKMTDSNQSDRLRSTDQYDNYKQCALRSFLAYLLLTNDDNFNILFESNQNMGNNMITNFYE